MDFLDLFKGSELILFSFSIHLCNKFFLKFSILKIGFLNTLISKPFLGSFRIRNYYSENIGL